MFRTVFSIKARRSLTILIFSGLILFKLWLIHGEEVIGAAGEYDQILNLKASRFWYWDAPYTYTAFMRPPGLPLFMAFSHHLGIPLRLALELLQLGSYLFLVTGLRKAGVSVLVCLFCYAALIFHPGGYQLYDYTTADAFYAAILGWSVAALLYLLLQNTIGAAIGAGFSLAILWITREESLLLPAIILIYVLLAFLRDFAHGAGIVRCLRRQLLATSSFLVLLAVLLGVVYYLNYCAFGSFAKSEASSAPFAAAYNALMRLRPAHPKRFIPVSRESRELAYEVSPSFRRLRGQLEGKMGRDWEMETRLSLGVPNEIAAGWFIWVLRDAASLEGIHASAHTANEFYRQVAREINAACDKGAVPSRHVFISLLDPHVFTSLSYVPFSMKKIANLFTLRYAFGSDREEAVLRVFQRDWYDELTDRRKFYTIVGRKEIDGWAFRFNDPVVLIEFRNVERGIDSCDTVFSPRPDVVKYFASKGRAPLDSQFHLSWDLYRQDDDSTGEIRFFTQSGAIFSLPWNSFIRPGNGAIQASDGGAPVIYNIDAQRFYPSLVQAMAAENVIGKYYRYLVFGLTYFGIAADIILLIFWRRLLANWRVCGAIALLAAAVVTRFLFFSFIDATSWPGAQPRYLFPVEPLYSCLGIIVIYQAARFLLQLRLPNSERSR